MIYVTRLNHTPIVLNSNLIEHIETAPDTIVSLTSGEKIMVLESAEEIIERVIEYQRKIHPLSQERLHSDSQLMQAETQTHGRR